MSGLTQDVVIINELGLHARAAAKLAKIALRARAKIWIDRDNDRADASSVIDILTLACPKGTTVSVSVEDASDRDVLKAMVALVENGFEE